MSAKHSAEPDDSRAELSDRSDTALWEALKTGNKQVLGILYDRHVGLVYAIALRTTRNVQDAEDLTQTIFLKLSDTNYDPKRGSLRTFLSILTRSRGLDLLRSRQRSDRREKLLRQQSDVYLKHDLEGDGMPLEEIDAEARARIVEAALGQLSENQRQVLHLAYREGLSQSEIADRIDAPLGTVKAWARRGLLKLRKSLMRLGEDSCR